MVTLDRIRLTGLLTKTLANAGVFDFREGLTGRQGFSWRKARLTYTDIGI
jgi:hypothetical protein